MQDLQEIYNRIKKNKEKQKKIKDSYKDALTNSAAYQEVAEKFKTIKAKKKQIEDEIKSQFNSEFVKLEDLKIDIESDAELLSDAALTKMMKGESVEIVDEYENHYEPHFTVKFKKI